MTEAKPKTTGTLAKIGRLFKATTPEPKTPAKSPTPGSPENDTVAAKIPAPRGRKPHALMISGMINGTGDTDDDVLAPLPNDRSRTASPRSAVSPTSSKPFQSLIDLSQPQPTHLSVTHIEEDPNTSRSSPASRLSSVISLPRKNSLFIKPKLSSLSRSSSTKRPNEKENITISPSVSSTQLSAAATPVPTKPRFKMFEDGTHEHNLRAARRQDKISNMLKDLLGAKKLRNEAKSAVPNILLPQNKPEDEPPTLFAGLVSQVKKEGMPDANVKDPEFSQQDCRSFVQKYGQCQEVIGRGSFGVVRISHKKADAKAGCHDDALYAVKEFKRKPNESEKKYSRRLTSEFCISSSLKHINIIDTLDLLKDAKGDYCEVMEFCLGGDLYTLIIAAGKLEYAEADCLFKQLIRGVNYMHDMGVAHRDLKPENLLLTQQGVLKITDFGNGECFRMAWEEDIHLSDGVCGSSPYIAPEEFTQKHFDPRCVDIWACGVIYMAMRTGRQLWKVANAKDEFFEEYIQKRKNASGYEPIESLKRARCRNVIYSILDPIPDRRITGKQILNSEWGREIVVCAAGNGGVAASNKSQEKLNRSTVKVNELAKQTV